LLFTISMDPTTESVEPPSLDDTIEITDDMIIMTMIESPRRSPPPLPAAAIRPRRAGRWRRR
jgi:hypothetical protein